MPIAQTDIKIRLSGGASNAVPAASLGGAKSSVEAAVNIFDDVSASEAAAGDVELRCVYVQNAHATLTLGGAVLWIPTNTPAASTTCDVGVGTSIVNGTEQLLGDEGAVPAGVVFQAAPTFETAVALGDIPPGQHRAVWIRRTINAGCPALNDTCQLRITGTTAP